MHTVDRVHKPADEPSDLCGLLYRFVHFIERYAAQILRKGAHRRTKRGLLYESTQQAHQYPSKEDNDCYHSSRPCFWILHNHSERGRGSTISLPIVGAEQVFRLECDTNPHNIRNEYPSCIDDDKLYWVSYSNSPEEYGSELYAIVSIGNPDFDSSVDDGDEYFNQYYGLTHK